MTIGKIVHAQLLARRSRCTAALFAGLILSGCASRDESAPPPNAAEPSRIPTLAIGNDTTAPAEAKTRGPFIELAPIELQETRDQFVGVPNDIMIADDGDIAIGDASTEKVLLYDRLGQFRGQTPGRGGAADEIGGVGGVGLTRRYLLVPDRRLPVVLVFDRRTLEFVGRVKVETTVRRIRTDEFGVLFFHLNPTRERAISATSEDDIERRIRSEEVLRPDQVEVPSHYRTSEPMHGIFGLVYAVRWSDTVAYSFAGDSTITVQAADGASSTYVIPAVRRKGHPDGYEATLRGGPKVPYPSMLSAISGQFVIDRGSDGRLIIQHRDASMDGPIMQAKTYYSILDIRTGLACIDLVSPFSDETIPRSMSRGDTLFVVDQQLHGENVSTTVRRFLIDTSACEWQRVTSFRKNTDPT